MVCVINFATPSPSVEDLKVKIKKLLFEAKTTQTEIASMLGVSVAAVHYVIKGKKKNPRIRKAISLSVGKPVSELWPEDQPKPEEKTA